MCGIAGYTRPELPSSFPDGSGDRDPHDGRPYRTAAPTPAHRIDDDVVFGHRRLVVIDREGGAQPMHDEAQGLTIVYNGEIYNYRELNASSRDLGYPPKHAIRHGDHPQRVRGVGRALRRASERDVRVRRSRREEPSPVRRPRPDGRKAAVLRARRTLLRVRLRAQGAPRSPRRRESQRRSARRSALLALRARARPRMRSTRA